MPQKINRTLLSVFIVTMVVSFSLLMFFFHILLHPGLQAEMFVGGGMLLFTAIAVTGALLKMSGKRRKTRSGWQWAAGLVIGPMGLGASVIIGILAHQAVAGIVVGAVVLIWASLYFLIGPRPKSEERG